VKAIATSAKKFDDTRIAWQLSDAQLLKSPHGSMNCLLGRFKSQVRRFPRVRASSLRDAHGVTITQHFVSSCSSQIV
jgi:hypothetical protein